MILNRPFLSLSAPPPCPFKDEFLIYMVHLKRMNIHYIYSQHFEYLSYLKYLINKETDLSDISELEVTEAM